MKKNLILITEIILAVALVTVIFSHAHKKDPEAAFSAPCDSLGEAADSLSREDTIAALAAAFAMQESKMNHKAVSPDRKYVGCLQISKICVAEANRILGARLFFDGSEGYIDDRMDRQGSYAIFKTIQLHHNPNLDIDRAIDIWNKGCSSQYRENIKKYFHDNIVNYNTLSNYFEIN